MFASFARGWIW